MSNYIIKRTVTVLRPIIREQRIPPIHKYFSSCPFLQDQISFDKPKTNDLTTVQKIKKAQLSQCCFNTYKVVKDLEGQGFTRGQAETIMRGMEALLNEGFKIHSNLLSKAELENETYLFQVSLSDFRAEMQIMRRNNLIDLNSENSLIQREVASLHQKLQNDIGKMRHFIQLDINNYKADIREEQKKKEVNIQEIENNFTVSSGDVRTDIEALKWETTRMALMGIFGSAVSALGVMFFTSDKGSKEILGEISTSQDKFNNESSTDEILSNS